MASSGLATHYPNVISPELAYDCALEAESLWDLRAVIASYDDFEVVPSLGDESVCRFLNIRLPNQNQEARLGQFAPYLSKLFIELQPVITENGDCIEGVHPGSFTVNYAEEFQGVGKHRDMPQPGFMARSYVVTLAGQGDFVVYNKQNENDVVQMLHNITAGDVHTLDNSVPGQERPPHDAFNTGDDTRITIGFQLLQFSEVNIEEL